MSRAARFRKATEGGGKPATPAHAPSSATEHAKLRHLARLLDRLAARHEAPPNATQAAGAHGADPTESDAIGDLPRMLDSRGEDDGRQRQSTIKIDEDSHAGRNLCAVLEREPECSHCGSACGAVGEDYLSCNAARRQGTCGNRTSIRRPELETLILDALRHQLMQPEHVAEFVAAYTAEWNRLAAEHSATTAAHRREFDSVTRKLDGLIDAIAEGFRGAGVQQKLDTLEARKAELTRLIATSEAPPPRLHPNLAETYRAKVADLHEALKAEDGGRAALEAVRRLIERVDSARRRIVPPGAARRSC